MSFWGIPALYMGRCRLREKMKVGQQEYSAGVQPHSPAYAERKEARHAVDWSGLDVEQYNKLSLDMPLAKSNKTDSIDRQ